MSQFQQGREQVSVGGADTGAITDYSRHGEDIRVNTGTIIQALTPLKANGWRLRGVWK